MISYKSASRHQPLETGRFDALETLGLSHFLEFPSTGQQHKGSGVSFRGLQRRAAWEIGECNGGEVPGSAALPAQVHAGGNRNNWREIGWHGSLL